VSSWDLVHFLIIPSSFTHSFNYPLYLHVTVIVPVHVHVPIYLRSWTKEAGFHARGILKRRVFNPMRNPLYVRELLGIDFLKVLNCIYMALRLHSRPIFEALERKWGIRGTIEQRKGTVPGVGQECGE
jgi:hypothetical protein